jgi:5'-methylthioadenosine phosphorylase
MRALGVHTVIGPCAAGSLSPKVHPGDFVVLDQLVDRTWGRADTYYDAGDAHHVSFADPYCPIVAQHAVDAGERIGVRMHAHGTVVVIPGPRFATRAESRSYRAQGWDVINMTQYPESYLARELGMHYAGIALVTDYDTGVVDDPSIEPVTQEEVFAFFEANVHRVRTLLLELIPKLPNPPAGCACADAVGPLNAYEN